MGLGDTTYQNVHVLAQWSFGVCPDYSLDCAAWVERVGCHDGSLAFSVAVCTVEVLYCTAYAACQGWVWMLSAVD